MDVYTTKHILIKISDSPLASGGEGEVRDIISAPEQYKGTCAKIYYQAKRTPQRAAKIRYMVNNPPSRIRGEGFMIGWPIECLADNNGAFIGFLMPLAFPGSKELVYLTSRKINKKLSKEWFDRFDRSRGAGALISRLKLICNISIPIYWLHLTGRYVLKDFKPANVLITYNGKVTIVDMDSIQITENGKLLYPGLAATPDYIPTEFYRQGIGNKRSDILSVSWDRFALGVVFYELLFGLHPYVVTPKALNDTNEIYKNISNGLFPFGENADKIESYPDWHNKFDILPSSVQELFLRTFSSDYNNRPGAEEWLKTISGIVKDEERKPIPKSESNPKPKPTPNPEPKPIPETESRPKPNPEPRPKPTPNPDSKPEPQAPASMSKGEIIVKCLLTAGAIALAVWLWFGLGWRAGVPAAPILCITIRNIWKMDFD